MTKLKDSKTKDSSTRTLMIVLLLITFISLLGGLLIQTSAFYKYKVQTAKLELRNLDLKMALVLSDLEIKWLKRKILKKPPKPKKKIPELRSI